jgi:hypothetical protein
MLDVIHRLTELVLTIELSIAAILTTAVAAYVLTAATLRSLTLTLRVMRTLSRRLRVEWHSVTFAGKRLHHELRLWFSSHDDSSVR